MYKKEFPRESTDRVVGDPCIPMDDYSFIWTSKNIVYVCRYKMKKIMDEEGRDQRLNKNKDENTTK
jgi:hypothetical protein